MSEVEILRGAQNKYESQKNQVGVLFAWTLFFAAAICVYFAALYVEAVLIGRVFGVALLLFAAALCIERDRERRVVLRQFELRDTRIQHALALCALGLLFVYLQLLIQWPWAFGIAGARLWIVGPGCVCDIPAWWVAGRWLAAFALPCALIPTGRALLQRIITEIMAPNWSASLRATPGQAVGVPFIKYNNAPPAQETATSPPRASWKNEK